MLYVYVCVLERVYEGESDLLFNSQFLCISWHVCAGMRVCMYMYMCMYVHVGVCMLYISEIVYVHQ